MYRSEANANYIASCKFENPSEASQTPRIFTHFLQIGFSPNRHSIFGASLIIFACGGKNEPIRPLSGV